MPNNTPIFKKRSNESDINSNKIGCGHTRTSENTENIKDIKEGRSAKQYTHIQEEV